MIRIILIALLTITSCDKIEIGIYEEPKKQNNSKLTKTKTKKKWKTKIAFVSLRRSMKSKKYPEQIILNKQLSEDGIALPKRVNIK